MENQQVHTMPREPQGGGTNTNKQKNMKMFGFALAGFFGFALLVSLGVGVYRVYAQTGTDGFTKTVATVLRLPAAKVNGKTILYKDYVGDLKAIAMIRSYDQQNGGGPAAALTDAELSDQVFVRIVNNMLVEQLAKDLDVKVEEADTKEVYDELLSQFGSMDKVEEEIKNRYGWNLDAYEKRVVKPLLLQNKVAEVISTNVENRETIRVKAQDVLNQIKEGADFAELAGQYGEDGTAAAGGSLGQFRPGDMVPAFEDAVKELKKGELAAELVETQYGYHIVQLDDVTQEDTTNAEGKKVKQPVWTARHILLMYPNINQKLNTLLQESNVKLYIDVNNPFADVMTAQG